MNWNGIKHLIQNKDTFSIHKSVQLEILVPVPDSSPTMKCSFEVSFRNISLYAYQVTPGQHEDCMLHMSINESLGVWEIKTTLSYDSRRKATKVVLIHAGKGFQ